MKTVYLLPLLIASILTGCTRTYVMRLNNGRYITTATKPKLKNGVYYWKDAKGEQNSLPQTRVMEIMPASMAEKESSRFNPSGR